MTERPCRYMHGCMSRISQRHAEPTRSQHPRASFNLDDLLPLKRAAEKQRVDSRCDAARTSPRGSALGSALGRPEHPDKPRHDGAEGAPTLGCLGGPSRPARPVHRPVARLPGPARPNVRAADHVRPPRPPLRPPLPSTPPHSPNLQCLCCGKSAHWHSTRLRPARLTR